MDTPQLLGTRRRYLIQSACRLESRPPKRIKNLDRSKPIWWLRKIDNNEYMKRYMRWVRAGRPEQQECEADARQAL